MIGPIFEELNCSAWEVLSKIWRENDPPNYEGDFALKKNMAGCLFS